MALLKLRPTTPGQRGMVRVKNLDLYKGRPVKALTEAKRRTNGRNNTGQITVRHRGGGHKRQYRLIDFKRTHDGIEGRVEKLEYDPNRSANIALISYLDGSRSYILAPKGLRAGDSVMSGPQAPISVGNTLPLASIPVGTQVHCVEMKPGKGGQMARSAGAAIQFIGREGDFAQLRLRSGEMRRIHLSCRATIGEVGNAEHALRKLGKAGAKRWRGIRPTVRGVAMNPVDHPHGGGEGRTSGGRDPVSPWGVPTKGFRTRHNKRTTSMIIRRRKK